MNKKNLSANQVKKTTLVMQTTPVLLKDTPLPSLLGIIDEWSMTQTTNFTGLNITSKERQKNSGIIRFSVIRIFRLIF